MAVVEGNVRGKNGVNGSIVSISNNLSNNCSSFMRVSTIH
jgi:hypothetical protein